MTLINVNLLVRNGIAAPRENLLKADPDQLIGNLSFNSLSNAGKRQMFVLGHKLNREYGDFLADARTHNNVTIRALNSMPCMMSAWALSVSLLKDDSVIETRSNTKLKALFSNKSSPETYFKSPLPGRFSITPVKFSEFEVKDYLFSLSSKNTCPNINTLIVKKEIRNLSEKFNFMESYERVAKALKFDPEKYGLTGVTQLYKAARLFEFMEAINAARPDPLFNSSSKEYLDLKKAYVTYIVSTVSTNATLSLLNAPIVNVITANMNNSITEDRAGRVATTKTLNVFVAHDKFMVAFLRFLTIYDSDCAFKAYHMLKPDASCLPFPDPGATIEIRLYRDNGVKGRNAGPRYFVQIYYNGMLKNLKKQTQTPDQRIEWNHFQDFLKNKIIEDWEKECGLGSIPFAPKSNIVRVVLLLVSNIVIFLLIAMAVFYCYWRTQNAKKDRKNSTLTESPNLDELLTHK
jgi:large-conductance mechanosensitive channel